MKGYIGKILVVDLTCKKFSIEEHDDKFWRMYLGGSMLGVYYSLRDIPKGADPLGPENVLTLAGSVITGAPAPGISRFSANAKSPLTGTIGDAQGGGFWGPELKYAGFEAIVIKGRSEKPVYIWIHDDEYEIRDASQLWGMNIGKAEEEIRKELSDEKIRVAGIGVGGENLVKYACIINERKHACGRTGMGAVMGSKNLKAIAVRGTKYKNNIEYHDSEAIAELSRGFKEALEKSINAKNISLLGTNGGLLSMNEMGQLTTRNFASGTFDKAKNISAEALRSPPFNAKRETCHNCPMACKRAVGFKDDKSGIEVDRNYGSPEYETMAMMGSNLLVDNLAVICKVNEICNKHSIDTVTLGAAIAFAMECQENGILSDEQCDGLDIRFGNADVLIPLTERIIKREGFIGNLLADGPALAAKVLGSGAERFAMHVKGNPMPAHMPHTKRGLGVHYALNPFGADHVSADQDRIYTPETTEFVLNRVRGYGLHDPVPMTDISTEKMRMLHTTQQLFRVIDSLGCCLFVYSTVYLFGLPDIVKLVNGVTGWGVTALELMRVGEKCYNMMRLFNEREGFTRKDDKLPDRMFEPFKDGPTKGYHIPEDEFEAALNDYYLIAGWDIETGNPGIGKIKELGLDWVKCL